MRMQPSCVASLLERKKCVALLEDRNVAATILLKERGRESKPGKPGADDSDGYRLFFGSGRYFARLY